jgi:hypothetical protein
MRKILLASTIALLGFTSTAQAHFGLVSPPQVVAQSDQSGKGSPPCGPDTGAAATPTAVQGGHPLMIKVIESVGHLGFYRVALALNSRTELPVDNVVYDAGGKVLPPSGMPAGTSARADTMNPAKFPVLADDFMAHEMTAPNMTPYMGMVMVPNVNCDRCILQVIEFMHPHGFNTSVPGPGGGYFYHHCAELKITADPALPLFNGGGTDGGTSDAGKDAAGAGTAGAGGGTGGAAGSGASGTGGVGTGGTTGTAGTNGAAGSTPGTAGTTVSGVSGSNGNAGSGSPGTAGATSGTAGSAGGSGGNHSSGGGGCSLTGNELRGVSLGALILMVAFAAARRRASR